MSHMVARRRHQDNARSFSALTKPAESACRGSSIPCASSSGNRLPAGSASASRPVPRPPVARRTCRRDRPQQCLLLDRPASHPWPLLVVDGAAPENVTTMSAAAVKRDRRTVDDGVTSTIATLLWFAVALKRQLHEERPTSHQQPPPGLSSLMLDIRRSLLHFLSRFLPLTMVRCQLITPSPLLDAWQVRQLRDDRPWRAAGVSVPGGDSPFATASRTAGAPASSQCPARPGVAPVVTTSSIRRAHRPATAVA